jgi:hypothetical protein
VRPSGNMVSRSRLRHRRLSAGRRAIGDRQRPGRAMAMPQTDIGGLQVLSYRTKSWRHTGACGPPADPFDGIPGWLNFARERPHSQWSGWLNPTEGVAWLSRRGRVKVRWCDVAPPVHSSDLRCFALFLTTRRSAEHHPRSGPFRNSPGSASRTSASRPIILRLA